MSKKTFQIRKTPPIRPMDLISQPKAQSRKVLPTQSPDSSLLYDGSSQNHKSKAELDSIQNETQKGINQEKLPRSAPLNQNKRLFRPKVDLKIGNEVPKPNISNKTPPTNHENRDISSSISRHARVAAKASFEEKRSFESSKSSKDLSLKRQTAKKVSQTETSHQETRISQRDRTNQELVSQTTSEKGAEESSILSQKQLEFTLAGFGSQETQQQEAQIRKTSFKSEKSDSPAIKISATVKKTPASSGLFISQKENSRNRLLSKELTAERNNSDKEKPVETLEDQADVEKLVQENKQLRNENTKKMEIIDILLHALKQQKETGPSPSTDLGVQINPFVDLNKAIPNSSSIQKKTPNHDSFETLRPAKPSGTEYLPRENLPPQIKAETVKRTPSHNYQPAGNKELGNNFRSESSPKLNYMKAHLQGLPTELTAPSSASEISRSNVRPKINYSNFQAPSSSQAPYRSNLLSTGEQIVNSIGNYDNFGFGESSLKRDNSWMLSREKSQTGSLASMQPSVYFRTNEPTRVLHENKNNQPNFIETFYPSTNNIITDPYNYMNAGGNSNTMKSLRYLGAQSVKGDVDIMAFKDSPNKFSSHAREMDSIKGIRSQGALIGMSAISIIDMGNAGNRGREDLTDEKPKLYIRDSGTMVSDRKIGVQSTDGKSKFPKDIFSVNVKKRFFG